MNLSRFDAYCFHNFTNESNCEFTVLITKEKGFDYEIVESINTDDIKFGGQGGLNSEIKQETIEVESTFELDEKYKNKFNRKVRSEKSLKKEKDKTTQTMVKYTIKIPSLSTVVIKEKKPAIIMNRVIGL